MASEAQIPELDEDLLVTSENPSIFVFQHLSSLEAALKSIAPTAFKTSQTAVEESLLRISTIAPWNPALPAAQQPASKYPEPGRAIRRLVGRCLVVLYERGETRSLFDTVQKYVKVINEPVGKSEGRESWRV